MKMTVLIHSDISLIVSISSNVFYTGSVVSYSLNNVCFGRRIRFPSNCQAIYFLHTDSLLLLYVWQDKSRFMSSKASTRHM